MALTPTTLQTMLTLLRERTNMENNQFVTDPELTTYLNNSLAVLDGILVSKFDDYKITPVFTTVTTNTNLIALPADFLKFRGLDIVYNNNSPDGYIAVKKYAFQKRNDLTYPGTSVTYGPTAICYRLMGQNVSILPAALAAQFQYRLWYTPDYIPLVNTTDTLQPYMDSQAWYEYAVVAAAVKVLAKQDLDPSIFMAQAAELKDHLIKLSTPNRDSGEPVSVVDTRGPWGGGYGSGGGYGWDW